MDQLTPYKQLMSAVMAQLAEQYMIAEKEIETVIVVDNLHGIYQLYYIGWDGHTRIQENHVHVRIKNGKFWIENDWTNDGLVTYLHQAGVPNDDIVLAFNPPEMRVYTEFAHA